MSRNTSTNASAMSAITLRPRDMTRALMKVMRTNFENAKRGKKRRPAFMWGPPGIAKSSLVEQICHQMNWLLVDIRLTQMEPTDLRGIPVPVNRKYLELVDGNQVERDETVVTWAIPELLPRAAKGEKDAVIVDEFGHKYDGAVLLLDELPNAAPSVQAGSYQLVLDGRLGEYRMPNNVIALAAGNRDTDKGSTFKMPTPLMNRFCHLELKTFFEDWQDYALTTTFDKNVVGFLSAFRDELFKFNATSASRGFATPRSWEMVSDYLRDGVDDLDDNVLTAIIAGSVGDATAVKFIEYRKNADRLPKASDVLDGKVTELKNVDVSLTYALTTSLCYELRDRYQAILESGDVAKARKGIVPSVDNFLGFIMQNFQREMVVMGARTMMSTYKIKFENKLLKNWSKFGDQYEKLVLAA